MKIKKIVNPKNFHRLVLWLMAVLMMTSVSLESALAQTNNLDWGEINNQTYDPRCIGAAGSSENPLVGDDAMAQSFNFLLQRGLSAVQAAAVVGNLEGESGIDPKAVNPSSGAYGIAQWLGGRKTGLFDFAGKQNPPKPPDDFATQLEWLWWEMQNTEKKAFSNLEKQTEVEKATRDWGYDFERASAGELESSMDRRIASAKKALSLSGNATSTTPSTGSSTGSCRCEGGGDGKTVVIDPGHSKNPTTETDPESGIKAADYENQPEMQEVWDVSEKVRTALEDAGFKVIMTKSNANASVGLIERANIANKAKAALAISIHNDHNENFDSMKWVTPQEVGLYRETAGKRKTFENQEVAQKSQTAANIYVEERKKAEGGNVQIHRLDFPPSRGLPATGNIAIVQLFSQVPWVYHEVGGKGFNADKYAAGLIEGTKKALGASDSGSCSSILGNGDAAKVAVGYAWPTYKGSGYTKRTEPYIQAIEKAQNDGKYIGGCAGVDCGGFVTRVMQDSKADEKYNDVQPTKGPVTSQEDYMKRFPDKYEALGAITSPSQLRPGDIAIAFDRGHTFMFVGEQPNFQTHIASASLCDRAPMAGREALSGNRWYRLKK